MLIEEFRELRRSHIGDELIGEMLSASFKYLDKKTDGAEDISILRAMFRSVNNTWNLFLDENEGMLVNEKNEFAVPIPKNFFRLFVIETGDFNGVFE
jgi:hypothetical protein